jgi:hypothetical protein
MTSMHKTVVQAVLLYGAVTGAMENSLQSFHGKCAGYITRKHIRLDPNEEQCGFAL